MCQAAVQVGLPTSLLLELQVILRSVPLEKMAALEGGLNMALYPIKVRLLPIPPPPTALEFCKQLNFVETVCLEMDQPFLY